MHKTNSIDEGKYKVNIDAGGAMTDGLFLGNGMSLTIKVDSTLHDLTVHDVSSALMGSCAGITCA